MFHLLPRFCARPFWRAQTFNNDVINSSGEAVLANTPFNPVGEITPNAEKLMEFFSTDQRYRHAANISGVNRNQLI